MLTFLPSFRVQVTNVEVEMAEISQANNMAGSPGVPHILEGPLDKKVFIGASIGPPLNPTSKLAGCGTFAAYLSANHKGQEFLLALTCDHVCFDENRPFQGLSRTFQHLQMITRTNTLALKRNQIRGLSNLRTSKVVTQCSHRQTQTSSIL
jgi:hypothetical protein